VRGAFFCALVACGLMACRYDYDALMGTSHTGTGGSAPGTGGDVAIAGRGGAGGGVAGAAAGGRGGGQGGSIDARGGAGGGSGGAGSVGAGGVGARGGDGGSTGAGGVPGSSAGTSGRGGAGGLAGTSGGVGMGGTAGGAAGAGAGGAGGTGTDRGGAGGGGAGGSTGAGGNPGSDLVLWYKFDDVSGMVALDSSTAAGAPHDGMLLTAGTGTGAFSTTHQVGTGALNLTGSSSSTNGAYINVPASINAMGATTAITIACWVNVTTDRAWGRLFDFNNSNTTGYMFLTTYQNQRTPNSVRFAISATNNAAEEQISSTVRLSTGVWHHLAVVLDAGATYTGTLYIDGVVAGTNAAMTLRPSSLGTTLNNWIGRSAYTTDPYFAGLIDDFRVYARALNASEITTLYATIR
jgi:hypothetical protein